MSEKKSLTKNYIYNLLYQCLSLIVPIITTPYLSRVLGAEAIGIYSYTFSIVTYFILVGNLGLVTYSKREIAYIQDDKEKRTKIFIEIEILKIISCFFITTIYYMIFAISGEYVIYYRILLIEVVANLLDISWFFQGIEEFKLIVIRNTIVKIISILLIFILVKTSNDLILYFLIVSMSSIFANLTLWIKIKKYLVKIDIKEIKFYKHFIPTLALFIPQIATKISSTIDKTMMGNISNNMSEVGFYEQTLKVINILITVVTSLGLVMMPRMSNTYAKGEKNKLSDYIKKSFAITYFMAIPIIFGIIAVAKNFVPIFYGSDYEKIKVLMPAMSIIILLMGMSNILGIQYLVSTKRTKEYTKAVTIGAIINIIINLILIPKYLSMGAIMATIFSETAVVLIELYFVRKDIPVKEILFEIKNYLISAIIMYLTLLIIDLIPINSDIIVLLIKVMIGVIMYITSLFIMKDKMLKFILNKILKNRREKIKKVNKGE